MGGSPAIYLESADLLRVDLNEEWDAERQFTIRLPFEYRSPTTDFPGNRFATPSPEAAHTSLPVDSEPELTLADVVATGEDDVSAFGMIIVRERHAPAFIRAEKNYGFETYGVDKSSGLAVAGAYTMGGNHDASFQPLRRTPTAPCRAPDGERHCSSSSPRHTPS